MRWKLVRYAGIALLIALPFVVRWAYLRFTALPAVVRIATGPDGGRYRALAENLAAELRSRLSITVETVSTNGSLENLQLLLENKADFALYQPQTLELLNQYDPHASASTREAYKRAGPAAVSFIANLYTQPTHVLVRSGSAVEEMRDLDGKHIHIGFPASGDRAMALLVLDHAGVALERVKPAVYNSYADIRRGFADGTLDAALLTVGVHAPMFRQLFADGNCRLLGVPFANALIQQRMSLSPYTIPAGLYRADERPSPPRDTQTVALQAEFLCRSQTHPELVREMTRIVLDQEFARHNQLGELLAGGEQFAEASPEFTVHPGARDVYDPHLHPVLDSEFVEATEGMRSFLASILIAGFLLVRWISKRRARQQEHRMDRYIKTLLEIERRQVGLDQTLQNERDIAQLQRMLDEITDLRQEALREFTAHELNEDRAADCFLEMCHALSDKLNAKLTRQRLAQSLSEILAAVQATRRE